MSKFKVGDKVMLPSADCGEIVFISLENKQCPNLVVYKDHGEEYTVWCDEVSIKAAPKPKRVLKQALLLCDVPPKAKTNKYVVTQVLYETLEEAQRDYRNAVRLLDYTAVEVDDE